VKIVCLLQLCNHPSVSSLPALPAHDTVNITLCLACRGTFPNIAALSKLQWLLLGGNQFSGPLPVQLGALPNLQQAQLQNNNFSGPVTSSWCSNMATYHVAFNPYLCGEYMLTNQR
jgi:hypothetical protein